MSPEESGLDAAAARMAWQLQSGWSATRVYLWWRSEYPLTDPGFLDRSLAQAEEMQATAERLRSLSPEQQIREAYSRDLDPNAPVGIRFAVEFPEREGKPTYRTYAVDVLPTATLEQVQDIVAEAVEQDLDGKYEGILLRYSETGRPIMSPINSLFGPLPQRLP